MKKRFVSLALCMALLSSFTVSASADFTSSDSTTLSNVYSQLTAIRDELGFPQGNYSSLRRAVNYIADHMPASSDYSTVLSNIKDNTDLLYQYIKLIEGDTNSITARATEIFNKLNDVYVRQGQMQLAITNHLDSGFSQNHSDLTSFSSRNHDDLQYIFNGFFSKQESVLGYINGQPYYSPSGLAYAIGRTWFNLSTDGTDAWLGERTLYSRLKQLQEVLASDDDLQLKKDNKANEDAATDGFVNGTSSKTSLGAGDFSNLKDIGGSFNDLSSLNGQSSVGSFTSGLSSADEVGQGWFSEATRASLDAVTPSNSLSTRSLSPSRSSAYSLSSDTSVRRAPASDPYHMNGFEDNYAWLWGDVS